ncbi:MAG: transglutaminase-like cysteine peptidase [Methylacidiphilales bacterium]|nr:transglutaminase-like cysteine peptidase [Candidatus Methylacidiphilales bacterium]
MRRLAAIMMALGATLATAQNTANAIPMSVTRLGNPIPKSTPMHVGRTVMAPIMAIRFCRDNAGQCQSGVGPHTVALSDERWAELEAVNSEVNATIVPKPVP